MKKFVVILILLSFLFSCSNQKNKRKNERIIDSLEQELVKQKRKFEDEKAIVSYLTELDRLKVRKIGWVQKERDSFNKLMKADNLNAPARVFIDYDITSNDKYWKRGSYYASDKENELLYNVRTSIIEGQVHFYFMGVKFPLEKSDIIANIYELDGNKVLHTIDSINISLGEEFEEEYYPKGDTQLEQFMLLQLSNLIIKNGKLYYFKIKSTSKDNYRVTIDEKEYYEYALGTKTKSQKVSNAITSNTIVDFANEILVVSPDNLKIAVNLGEELNFYNIPNWEVTRQSILSRNLNFDELQKIDFDLKDNIKYEQGEQLFFDDDTGENLLFGGICWHTEKNILYFDNSGVTYRCIWEVNFDTHKVTKIVPEHEAIHPFYFEIENEEYIAYVEGHKIMLCESPNNKD